MTYYSFHYALTENATLRRKKNIFDPFWNQNRQTFNVFYNADVMAKNILPLY